MQERRMIYKLLAYFTILLHFVWIVFLIFGFYFALKKSKIAWFHLAGLLFSLILNIMGWYCPLTYLENYLHYLGDRGSEYGGSFILKYSEYIIYPDLPETYIRIVGIIFVGFYTIFYVYMAKKYHVLRLIRGS